MKNKNIFNAIKIVCFFSIFIVILLRVYKILSWKDTTGEYLSSVQQLYATGDNLIDVAFVGSSHVYCGIIPAVLWQERGISAFDMAISGMDKGSSVHSLIELLKTQSPKVVFVDIYPLAFDQFESIGNEYRNYISLRLSKNAIDLIKEYAAEDKQQDYIARWPIIHSRYKELDKYDFVPNYQSIYGRGVGLAFERTPVTIKSFPEVPSVELSNENKNWIYSLIGLSRDYDFELVFMLTPSIQNETSTAINNAAMAIAEQNGIPFFDFNQLISEIGISEETDFCDEHHLNAYGAEKLTRYICENVLDSYELEDHRRDPMYSFWDLDSKEYDLELYERKIKEASTLSEYAKLVSANDEYISILSIEDNEKGLSSEIVAALSEIGIVDPLGGGKWIIIGDTVKQVCANDSSELIYAYQLNKENNLLIHYYGYRDAHNIIIDGIPVMPSEWDISIVTYNKFTDKVVYSTGFDISG